MGNQLKNNQKRNIKNNQIIQILGMAIGLAIVEILFNIIMIYILIKI